MDVKNLYVPEELKSCELLEVNYPQDRAAMYLYFYFIGAFAFTLDSLIKNNKSKERLSILDVGGDSYYDPATASWRFAY